MTKAELIKEIATKTGFTQKDVKVVMETMGEIVFNTLPVDEVKVMDGVTLYSEEVAARVARNPRTGENVDVPAHKKVKCKLGKAIKDAVNA